MCRVLINIQYCLSIQYKWNSSWSVMQSLKKSSRSMPLTTLIWRSVMACSAGRQQLIITKATFTPKLVCASKIPAIHKFENQSKTDMQPRMVSLMVHWIVSLCFACYHDRLTMYSLCWKEITKKCSCTRFSVCCKLQIKPCAYPVLSVMIIMALMLIIINHVTWYQRSPTVTG